MRILMLSWEYPPRIVGGISRHVYDLSKALARRGIKVDVITCEHPGAPEVEEDGSLSVYRVPVSPGNDFIHWVHNLNASTEAQVEKLLAPPAPSKKRSRSRKKGEDQSRVNISEPTLIHAHDWLSAFAGKNLKHKFKIPLVATIHATEHGRNHGIHNDTQRYIHGVEWELCYEAWRVICCSYFMRDEIAGVLQVPYDKMDVIPNGVDATKFDFSFDAAGFRSMFARPEEKIVFFVGRMVPEKGVQVLIEAIPEILPAYSDVKFVIVGGGERSHLVKRAEELGVSSKVFFTGYVDDDTLLKLYKVADVAVYPSLYEPFGIVALEAMAAQVPVVVSDVGGLREVVDHGVTGLTAWADNPDSLAWAILRILKNPYSARQMVRNAYRKVVDQFSWDRIAEQTASVYDRVWSEYLNSDWGGGKNV
jgi:glycosyltransferase involved in cell wall biosynthesis